MRAPRADRWISREVAAPLLGGLVAAALLFSFWELLEDVAIVPGVNAFDGGVTAFVQSWRTPMLTYVFRAFTFLGNVSTMTVLTAAAAGALVWRGRRADARMVIATVVGGALLSDVMKALIERQRPLASNALIDLPVSFSFPSGHAMASLMFFGALAYLAIRSERFSVSIKSLLIAACIAAAVLVGLSRVYLGVHWPSDVVASWCLGGAWLALVVSWFEARRRVHAEQARP